MIVESIKTVRKDTRVNTDKNDGKREIKRDYKKEKMRNREVEIKFVRRDNLKLERNNIERII